VFWSPAPGLTDPGDEVLRLRQRGIPSRVSEAAVGQLVLLRQAVARSSTPKTVCIIVAIAI
jgi:hypothetical protein